MKRSALGVLALAAAVPTAAAAQNLGNSLKVDRLEFPVSVGAGLGAPSPCTIVGYLYYHGSFRERPLQVLVHGATYTHTYWDFPRVGGEDYSYARYMAAPARKYAVLAIDQLGAGESCKPANGLLVTLDETASALEQVIGQLRSGQNSTGYAFESIALVGHSAGSINAIAVQAKSHPADALVVTAARHIASVPFPPGVELVLPFVPTLATLPYFSLPPDLRTALFYYTPSADSAVIAADNATADAWTGGQVTSTFAAFLHPVLYPPIDGVNLVTGDVLVQLGEFDALFPAGAPDVEIASWTNARVTVQELPGLGHDFNLHFGREESWKRIDTWLRETLAR
jgi:pimeloyl-ACP methyl ester carboxylesterase